MYKYIFLCWIVVNIASVSVAQKIDKSFNEPFENIGGGVTSFTVTLVNDTTGPLCVSNLVVSCNCFAVSFVENGLKAANVEPGSSKEISIQYDGSAKGDTDLIGVGVAFNNNSHFDFNVSILNLTSARFSPKALLLANKSTDGDNIEGKFDAYVLRTISEVELSCRPLKYSDYINFVQRSTWDNHYDKLQFNVRVPSKEIISEISGEIAIVDKSSSTVLATSTMIIENKGRYSLLPDEVAFGMVKIAEDYSQSVAFVANDDKGLPNVIDSQFEDKNNSFQCRLKLNRVEKTSTWIGDLILTPLKPGEINREKVRFIVLPDLEPIGVEIKALVD